jgi:hypothetical protein
MDVQLDCSAENCVYNMDSLCSANKINVQGINSKSSSDTFCDTFQERGVKNAFKSLTNMNLGGEIKQVFNNDEVKMNPKIGCTATSCMYNTERVCTAADVQIYGPGAEQKNNTSCLTFRE